MLFSNQVRAIYRSKVFVRFDDTGLVRYFGAGDFPGLHREDWSFSSSLGHPLRGAFYGYDDPIPGRLVVFDHGMGGGHTAYMREIEQLCRHGFRVFAYDHTGCMASGGDSCNGLAQSLRDLDDCITALKGHPQYGGDDLSVMGHSWGGFSALNITGLHPEVTHVVAMSGFVSVHRMLAQTFRGPLALYRKELEALEQQTNPRYAAFDARETLAGTDAAVLVVQSDNDPQVVPGYHFDLLRRSLENRPNICFYLNEGRGHSPNYTPDAVQYKDAFFRELQKQLKRRQPLSSEEKKAFVDRYDWRRMTAQDGQVWQAIFKTLDESWRFGQKNVAKPKTIE